MKSLIRFKSRVALPTTPSEFDALVSEVAFRYDLTDRNHAAAIISVAIRHLPNDQAYTTYKYLGHTVLKNIANYVANFKGETIKHENQVQQLSGMLEQDPYNQQARDELQKAADAGSPLAKAALERLDKETIKADAKILNLVAAETGHPQVPVETTSP